MRAYLSAGTLRNGEDANPRSYTARKLGADALREASGVLGLTEGWRLDGGMEPRTRYRSIEQLGHTERAALAEGLAGAVEALRLAPGTRVRSSAHVLRGKWDRYLAAETMAQRTAARRWHDDEAARRGTVTEWLPRGALRIAWDDGSESDTLAYRVEPA